MKPTRIFITDDYDLILEGLASLIEGIPGLVLVGKASSGDELIAKLENAAELPDLCILDIQMPGPDGVETLKILKKKFPAIKVLILTMHEEPFYINRMIKEGADGYLLKNLDREAFQRCISMIMNGESFFIEGFSKEQILQKSGPPSDDPLTAREKHILKLIAQGKSNKEIAADLFISPRTVDTHRNNLKRKLNAPSAVHLVHYAYKIGLV